MSQHSFNSKKSNDHDFVKPTTHRRTQQSLPDLTSFEIYPDFQPLKLNNRSGGPVLPPELDSSDPLQLFDIFFPPLFIQYCVRCTNSNATSIRRKGPEGRAKWSRYRNATSSRPWTPVTAYAMYAYLGIYVYMNLHPEPRLQDYWSTAPNKPSYNCVRKTMSLVRWQQIHRYFHVWDLSEPSSAPGIRVRPMDKMRQISDWSRDKFKAYWSPGTHVTVDEAIAGFTGRTPETVNIPSKPVPIGYKLWVLADAGYVLDFLFHVKGDKKDQGPQQLRTQWKELGFNPTQSVVCELVTRLPSNGRGHAIWLDNLFTNGPQCRWLRTQGIGCSGTVRTTQTEREENEEKRLKSNKRKRIIEEGAYAIEEDDVQSSQSITSFPTSQHSLSDLSQISQSWDSSNAYASQDSQTTIDSQCSEAQISPFPLSKRRKTTQRTPPFAKEPGFGMHPTLVDIKTKWYRQIPCGKQYYWKAYASQPDQEVLQIAWRDSSVVLFMTNCLDGRTLIQKHRKRPAKAAVDPMLRTLYGSDAVKLLDIPLYIDNYNHYMNGVDRADQLRSMYRTPRKSFKTWRPLWDYILFTSICNLALIAAYATPEKWDMKRSGHAKFREELSIALMSRFDKSKERKKYDILKRRTHTATQIDQLPIYSRSCNGELVKIGKQQDCVVCKAEGNGVRHKKQRKPLEELSAKSLNRQEQAPRYPRTLYKCNICNIAICKISKQCKRDCWQKHIA